MRMSRFHTGLLAALLGATVGCDAGTAGPDVAGELSSAEAEALAASFDFLGAEAVLMQMAAVSEEALAAEAGPTTGSGLSPDVSASPAGASVDPVTRTWHFVSTRDCPLGGHVRNEGERTAVRDADAGTLRMTLIATRSHRECAHERSGGVVITTDGEIDFTAERYRENGVPVGPQTQTHQGAFTWSTSTGRAGSCTVALSTSFEFDAAGPSWTRTVQGTFCNRTIDRTVTWTRTVG